jgi:hypothetical protein
VSPASLQLESPTRHPSPSFVRQSHSLAASVDWPGVVREDLSTWLRPLLADELGICLTGFGPGRELADQRAHPLPKLVGLLDDERKAEPGRDRRDPTEPLNPLTHPHPGCPSTRSITVADPGICIRSARSSP